MTFRRIFRSFYNESPDCFLPRSAWLDHAEGRPQASSLRLVESYLRDMGMSAYAPIPDLHDLFDIHIQDYKAVYRYCLKWIILGRANTLVSSKNRMKK